MAANGDRQYDLILFGATGFTGGLTADHLAEYAPTNLKWAVAGRSELKLQAAANILNKKFPDREPVGTFVADLKPESLKNMAEAARLIITTVGPYCRYGSPLVEACANAGTHYVDCTGEHVWVLDMINKYHETARKNGAIIIPQCAFESAPADISSFAIAGFMRNNFNIGTGNITFSLHDLVGGASGGTIETFLSVVDTYSFRALAASRAPLALSPVKQNWSPNSTSLIPVGYNKYLGYLAPWVQAVPDRAIVMRSWGLMKSESTDKVGYGDSFNFEEKRRVPSRVHGFGLWLAIGILGLAVAFSPIRWLARKFVTQPGDGPSAALRAKGRCEWRALGESEDGKKKAVSTVRYSKGEAYMLTGLLIAEAGLSILFDKGTTEGGDKRLVNKMGGGILTPACLGEAYIDRLNKVGVLVDVKEV